MCRSCDILLLVLILISKNIYRKFSKTDSNEISYFVEREDNFLKSLAYNFSNIIPAGRFNVNWQIYRRDLNARWQLNADSLV